MNINRINWTCAAQVRTTATQTNHFPGHGDPHTIQKRAQNTKPSDSSHEANEARQMYPDSHAHSQAEKETRRHRGRGTRPA